MVLGSLSVNIRLFVVKFLESQKLYPHFLLYTVEEGAFDACVIQGSKYKEP